VNDDEITHQTDQPEVTSTPANMSPDHARGEGHRVDGRSDIFSLGIVLYQTLTDTKPFQGDVRDILFQEIIYQDPIHPCEIDQSIPPELARICLKSLSKTIHDRYASCELMVATGSGDKSAW